ncbi:uncharacterized protein CLUP02_12435 [Colletotrichum lupini]|uniref:Uncharacterized protein n=1 Tax=Colletotrichum lupini TaxID=145971 RepID=A0A9Q8WKG1_9PEZI|nr:uncharacterized protein CLUP02_12435 [Colletotrichum lupini]UQC86933.1 hypothetical protein CLUP02_12435 [Colletotrichum lupini]
MEGNGVPAAEASSQPPAKRVKLSSPASDNTKPVFGRLGVILNTEDAGDITVNISNTRRLGKPVIDHLSEETFAFHGSRQQAHAMLDRILDHSENTIIMGIVSLQPDISEATPQSKAPATVQAVDVTGAASENSTVPKRKTPMKQRPATSIAMEKTAPAGERPLAPTATHQSRQTSNVADNPKPFAPQNSSLVLSQGHLETAYRVWTTCGRRTTKLQTLLKKFPENDRPNPSVECMVLQKLAGKAPDMMVGELEGIVHSYMLTVFKHNLRRRVPRLGKDWMHFRILRRLWFYPDVGEDVDFPWAEMAPNSSAGCPSSAYATFKEHNGVGIESKFSIFD